MRDLVMPQSHIKVQKVSLIYNYSYIHTCWVIIEFTILFTSSFLYVVTNKYLYAKENSIKYDFLSISSVSSTGFATASGKTQQHIASSMYFHRMLNFIDLLFLLISLSSFRGSALINIFWLF